MKSKWTVILLVLGATAGIVWVLVLMLFGDISAQLYDSLEAEAKFKLSYLCELQTAEFKRNGKYSTDMEAIGFYQGNDDGSRFTYQIGLADSVGFVARAFATTDYDQDQERLIFQIAEDCNFEKISED